MNIVWVINSVTAQFKTHRQRLKTDAHSAEQPLAITR